MHVHVHVHVFLGFFTAITARAALSSTLARSQRTCLSMLLLLAPAIVQALLPEDERATEELFQRFSCQHAYLDLGANIGVQIRKLYQAELYPRAPALSLFNASFGPPPRCRVCSIGVEPNPRHATRLSQLMERYQRAGVGVLVLNAAISDDDGFTLLKDHNRTDHWIARHGGTRLQVAAQVDEGVNSSAAGKASVRKLDLASLLHVVDRLLVRMHGARQRASDDSGGPGRISMKMGAQRGIELAEPHTQRDQFPGHPLSSLCQTSRAARAGSCRT